MGELIDDLLEFSRLGRQVLSCQKLDLVQLVNGVLEDFAGEIAQHGIAVIVGVLPAAQADPVLLRQVLVNLIGNAIKFTARTTAPMIEITAREEDGATIYSIRDNGAGFDMAYAGKLFGVFQRLHTQEEFPGTGVGLAIVQNIIQRHGGTVWAESRAGEGTIVSFRLNR
jgi:light-regulated signal transduction histidine kinase (bacteriophytochrome)